MSEVALPLIPPQSIRFMGESDELFLPMSKKFAGYVLDFIGPVGSDYRVLDVGCGYGRLAYGLLSADFPGRYVGFDVLRPQISWLQDNFAVGDIGRQFTFGVVDIYNERYNPDGQPLQEVSLPDDVGTADCICALSVFTHMYQSDIEDYFDKLSAFMPRSGKVVATFFCLPDTADPYETSTAYPLVKQVSPVSYIHSEQEPLYMIAYRRHFLMSLFRRHRLRIIKEIKGRWHSVEDAAEFQDWFFLERS